MKDMVFMYLDGNSDVKAERKIRAFLSQDEDNRMLFSQWEMEWKLKRGGTLQRIRKL